MCVSAFCACTGETRNTGVPPAQRKFKTGDKIIYVPRFDDEGNENVIKRSDLASLNQAFFQAKVTEPDPSKRWYPIGVFTEPNDVREDPVFKDYADGSRDFIRQGRKGFTGMLIGYEPAYGAVIKSLACQLGGIFTIDDCGEPTGLFCESSTNSANDAFKPQPLNASSIYSLYNLFSVTNSSNQNLMVSLDYDMLMSDDNLRKLSEVDLNGANLLTLEGLRPTLSTISAEATTGFLAAIQLDFARGIGASVPITGLAPTDFRLYNETTLATVAISSVTEIPKGTYLFTFAAQTSADVLTLTQASGTAKPFGIEAEVTIP
jgi:hypothetical protein